MVNYLKSSIFAGLSFMVVTLSATTTLADSKWDGRYLGGVGSYNFFNQDSVIHQTAPPLDIHGNFNFEDASFGVLGGYNFVNGKWITGVEAAFLLSANGRSLVGNSSYSDLNWQAEILLRLGYDMGSYMPFLVAGPAIGSFSTQTFITSPPVEFPKVEQTHIGLTLGVGVEAALSESMNWRMEYRYTKFFEEAYPPSSVGGNVTDNEFESHAIRGALVFSF